MALSRLSAAADLAAEGDVFDDKRYAIRVNDEVTVDVMRSIAGLSWEEMKPHVTSMSIDGVSVDLPGSLKTKQGARPKDQMDAAVIAAALESSAGIAGTAADGRFESLVGKRFRPARSPPAGWPDRACRSA